MALFCFPDELAQPLARSKTNKVWKEGGRDKMCLWEKVCRDYIVLKRSELFFYVGIQI